MIYYLKQRSTMTTVILNNPKSPPEGAPTLDEAMGSFINAQNCVRKWQLSICEQNTRSDLGVLGRCFSNRVSTIQPLTEALESVKDMINIRDGLEVAKAASKTPFPPMPIEYSVEEINRLQGLVLRALDRKLKEPEEWTSSQIYQYIWNIDESVTTKKVADKLVSEGRKLATAPRPLSILPSDLEKTAKAMLVGEARGNICSEVGVNMLLTGAAVAGIVAAVIYLKGNEPLKLPELW
ncbi:MAG: hypothetical protein V4489_07655 [Chlamydiota bacterium]